MNKEEILEKSRRENRGQDERDKIITTQSMSYGAVGMAIMFLILFFIQMSREGTVYNLLAMYFAFLASSDIFKYRILKGKNNLFTAVCYSLAAIIWLALYIFRG